ncbi:MAG: DUF7227 family protein, partial [Myxococcota bacterium]
KSLLAVADAVRSAHVVGWTFTHKQPSYGDNAAAIAEANRRGFAINMSAHGPAHADELMDLGIGPVVTLLPCEKPLAPRKTPKGRPIVFCPASMKGSRITCRTCGKGKGPLCARIDRDYVVGFFAHGPAKRVAEATYRPGLPVVA